MDWVFPWGSFLFVEVFWRHLIHGLALCKASMQTLLGFLQGLSFPFEGCSFFWVSWRHLFHASVLCKALIQTPLWFVTPSTCNLPNLCFLPAIFHVRVAMVVVGCEWVCWREGMIITYFLPQDKGSCLHLTARHKHLFSDKGNYLFKTVQCKTLFLMDSVQTLVFRMKYKAKIKNFISYHFSGSDKIQICALI